ncbi:MAG: helix-turn-helix transcriptional regulator [Planctomycetota bacterium]
MAARRQHRNAYRRLCTLLRRMREEAQLTQRELATRLKMHNSMVHRSEIGDRRIDPVEFAEWCRACDVDPGQAIRQLQ